MVSGVRSLDIDSFLNPDDLARQIANQYQEWEIMRQTWLNAKQEVLNYIYAIDTSTTSNALLPWKNSTHMPKLCQIRDNLEANYMAALFPNDRPIQWEGDDESSESKDKREVIEAYMENKMRLGQFRTEIGKCIDDFIAYGNCFGMAEFVAEKTKDPGTGEDIPGFVGPKAVRISPLDIVFNPTATSFTNSPKIIRSLKTLGGIKADLLDHPELGYLEEVFDLVKNNRHKFTGMNMGDFKKTQSYQFDGFNDWLSYFQSDYVEVLDFYGDYYDQKTDTFYKNQLISIVDRCYVIRNITNPSWFGTAPIFHVGWRKRPDNLYAMGPLDNLVGMQYRIDHLENAKADAYDLIIHPVQKITGFVEDFEYGPNERIYCGDEGDVEFMRPDTTMLSADTQIGMYEAKMEEMAGAPKQAMGFRTPGEKTAYEVQILENGANRVFINKTSYFEEMFVEPLINCMLEVSRRNMGVGDVIRVVDDKYGAVAFMSITKEDITARGKIRPIGARHFARNANLIQNLTQLAASPLGQNPSVQVHFSGKGIAHLMEELLGIERYHLVSDNIGVAEAFETEKLKQSAQQLLGESANAGAGQQGVSANANGMVQPPQDQGGTAPVQGASPGQS